MSRHNHIINRLQTILSAEPHPVSLEFYDALVGCAELHHAKQHDYGRDDDPFANVRASQEFNIEPWCGALLRLNDKVTRLKTYCKKGTLKNEGVEDSLRDIAVYALIALVLFREKPMESQSRTIAAMHSAVMDSMTEAVKAACVAKEPVDGAQCRPPQPPEMQQFMDRLERVVARKPDSPCID